MCFWPRQKISNTVTSLVLLCDNFITDSNAVTRTDSHNTEFSVRQNMAYWLGVWPFEAVYHAYPVDVMQYSGTEAYIMITNNY